MGRIRCIGKGVTGIIVVLGLALFPSGAGAASTLPPGNSGTDQYTENIPGAAGDTPSRDALSGKGGGGARTALSPVEVRALESGGTDGAAAAVLAAATAPPLSQPDGGDRTAGRSGAGDTGVGDRASFVVGGHGGMGIAFPILIVVGLCGAVGIVAARRRRARAQVP